MSRDITSTVAVGRLTADCEYKQLASGKELARFSLACSYGKEKDEVSFFDVNVWGKTAAAVHSYLVKGKRVAIQGRLRQERWEKDGVKRSRVIIEADSVQLLDGGDRPAKPAPEAEPEPAPFDDKGEIPF